MEKKKTHIQIKDLDVNLEKLKKIRPEVLAKIRGGLGYIIYNSMYGCTSYACQGGRPNSIICPPISTGRQSVC